MGGATTWLGIHHVRGKPASERGRAGGTREEAAGCERRPQVTVGKGCLHHHDNHLHHSRPLTTPPSFLSGGGSITVSA